MPTIVRGFVAALMLSFFAGCLSDGSANGLHRRLESDLRRACMAQAGGPRVDSVELLGGRMHTACVRWAHRQAARLAPPG